MPTGIGRNIVFTVPPGVNAFGTNMSGLVLKTFTVMYPTPVHPNAVVAVTAYLIILSSIVKIACGFGINGSLSSMTGDQEKLSGPGSLDEASNCKGCPITTEVSLPAFTITGASAVT